MTAIHEVFEAVVPRPASPPFEGPHAGLPAALRHDLSAFEAMDAAEQAAALDGVFALLGRRFRSGETDTAARVDEHAP